MYSVLVNPELCGYPTENVKILNDAQATHSGILTALSDLAKSCVNDSSALIYISSHGGRIDSGVYIGQYLLPVETVYHSNETIAKTAISTEQFTQSLRSIPARKLVVIFDCCHAGGIGQHKVAAEGEFKSGLSEITYQELAAGRGRVIIASSRSDEKSWILPGAQNSLFTQHLLDGLKDGTPAPGGMIRIFDLFDYIQPRVTKDKPIQHPVFKAELEENFPIALSLGGKGVNSLPEVVLKDEFAYDVFISYSHQDKVWVKNILVSALEEAGIKVFIDYKDIRIGAPLVTEIAHAVEKSRYTLAVLTPAYLESNFTELENILAEHLGLEKSQRRLLAVMREECVPRLGIRARLWLDMSSDEEFHLVSHALFTNLIYLQPSNNI